MSNSTTSNWTIKNDRIYHVSCDFFVGMGMLLRHEQWGDGYCASCGTPIPDEWVRKINFIFQVDSI